MNQAVKAALDKYNGKIDNAEEQFNKEKSRRFIILVVLLLTFAFLIVVIKYNILGFGDLLQNDFVYGNKPILVQIKDKIICFFNKLF